MALAATATLTSSATAGRRFPQLASMEGSWPASSPDRDAEVREVSAAPCCPIRGLLLVAHTLNRKTHPLLTFFE
jgi:hypothetical protein